MASANEIREIMEQLKEIRQRMDRIGGLQHSGKTPKCPPDAVFDALPECVRTPENARRAVSSERCGRAPMAEVASYAVSIVLLIVFFSYLCVRIGDLGTMSISTDETTWGEAAVLPPIAVDDVSLGGYELSVKDCTTRKSGIGSFTTEKSCTDITDRLTACVVEGFEAAACKVHTTDGAETCSRVCLPKDLQVQGGFGQDVFKYIQMRWVAKPNTTQHRMMNVWIKDHTSSLHEAAWLPTSYHGLDVWAEKNVDIRFKHVSKRSTNGLFIQRTTTEDYLTFDDVRTRIEPFFGDDCTTCAGRETERVSLDIFIQSSPRQQLVDVKKYSASNLIEDAGGFWKGMATVFSTCLTLYLLAVLPEAKKKCKKGSCLSDRDGNDGTGEESA